MAMTKPEETTAALIARLHEQLNESNQARDHWEAAHDRIKTERDEQRARTEKAEAELAQHQSNYGQAWRQSTMLATRLEAAEKTLTERTRERDEARRITEEAQGITTEALKQRDEARERNEAANKVQRLEAELAATRQLAEMHAGAATTAEDERDEAREQLAKLEWSAFRRPDCGGPLSVCCPICEGVKPGHEVGSAFKREQFGHRPTCWFAKRDTVNGTITHPMGELKVELPRNPKNGDTITVSVPLQPGMSLELGADGVYRPIPARPEPRFKVGEKVVTEDCLIELSQGELRAPTHKPTFEPWLISDIEWARMGIPCWWYRQGDIWINERLLRPAPKFAVGEWVMHRYGPGEVLSHQWSNGLGCWSYQVTGIMSEVETGLTDQTPQHKHDCKGCVFLGRMDTMDLYCCADPKHNGDRPGLIVVMGGNQRYMTFGSEPGGGCKVAEEARRRAVARGLVKP